MTDQTSPDYSTAPRWEPQTKRYYWMLLGLILLGIVIIFWPVVPFIFFATLLAYLTMPIVRFFNRHLFRDRFLGGAIALTLFLVLALIIGNLLLFVPPIIEQTEAVVAALPASLDSFLSTPISVGGSTADDPFVLRDWLDDRQYGQNFVAYVDNLNQSAADENLNLVTFVFGSLTRLQFNTVDFLTGAVQNVLNGIFFVIVLIYLWSDWDHLVGQCLQIPPVGYREDARRLLLELGQTWHRYLRGSLLIGGIMGTIAYVLALIFGLPNPLFIGVVVGLIEFIPGIGPALAGGVLAVTALLNTSATFPELSGFPLMILVGFVWIICLQFQGGVLTPRILGGSLRLHPVMIIVAILWGAATGGVVGIIIAGPIVATLRIGVQYIYGRLTNRPAFLPMESSPSLQLTEAEEQRHKAKPHA